MGQIEPLHPDLIEQATQTLARSFIDDPMFRWVYPDPTTRLRSLYHVNRLALEVGMRYGRARQTERGRATAVWFPPESKPTTVRLIRCGMLWLPFRMGFGAFAKCLGVMSATEQLHKKHSAEPHWYLMVIGVDPELQGGGKGTALIREGLAWADKSKRSCYLETTSERNIPLYEHFGFQLMEELPLGSGGPPVWALRRDAVE